MKEVTLHLPDFWATALFNDDTSGFEYEDEKECDGDAWEGHSNRSSMLADYLCVRLTKAQLMSQRQRVRVASYRWQGVKREGKMGLTAPNNYEWFLAFIDAEALVGWMDFMSNVIVGVETKLTLAYMGMLYAEVPTCAGWLREPSKIPEAMSRGWIYQESTFGQLDPSLARQLSDYLYDEYRKEHTPASARAMVEMIWNIALLLLRRGHENPAVLLREGRSARPEPSRWCVLKQVGRWWLFQLHHDVASRSKASA